MREEIPYLLREHNNFLSARFQVGGIDTGVCQNTLAGGLLIGRAILDEEDVCRISSNLCCSSFTFSKRIRMKFEVVSSSRRCSYDKVIRGRGEIVLVELPLPVLHPHLLLGEAQSLVVKKLMEKAKV